MQIQIDMTTGERIKATAINFIIADGYPAYFTKDNEENVLDFEDIDTLIITDFPPPTVVNQSIGESRVWTEDGGFTFTEAIRQEYSNCIFSAGFVEGYPPDTLYLKLERDDKVDTFLWLRPDEMAAIGWLATGVLWSHHRAEMDKAEPEEAEGGDNLSIDVT